MTEEDKKATTAAAAPAPAAQIQSFDPTAKKRKKPAKKAEKKAPEGTEETKKEADAGKPEDKKAVSVDGRDQSKDYEYKFLLERINGLLLSKKDSSARKKVLIKPPDVQRLTGKRCAWVNFDVSSRTS